MSENTQTDWRIDHTAGRPILVYQNCSVIEAEQAEYVLGLIEADKLRAAGEPVAWEIRFGYRQPASVELTPFASRAEEARRLGLEVHDLVRRGAAPQASAEAMKECRHCGWMCSPNREPSKPWYPLAAPAVDPVSDGKTRVVGEHLTGGCLNWDDGEDSAKGAANPVKRWPFVESPGEFTERLAAALKMLDGNLLPAVRHVLIEHPPTLADRQQRGGDVAALREALKFYADRDHFILSDETAWDTVSGEPQNFWCDEAGTATVEDGSIARAALAGQPIASTDTDDATRVAAQPVASAELVAVPVSDIAKEHALREIIAAMILEHDEGGITLATMSAARAAIYQPYNTSLAAQKPDGGDAVHSLITEKFRSGNAIPVERITITRAEYDAAISAQQGKEGK